MFLDRRLCPAARGLIGWSQKTLALHSNVSQSRVRAFEHGDSILYNNEEALQRALQSAGVVFSVDVQGNLSVSYNADDGFEYVIIRRKRKLPETSD